MSEQHRLPQELWSALQQQPNKQLQFRQDGFIVEIHLRPPATSEKVGSDELLAGPTTPPPTLHALPESVDEIAPPPAPMFQMAAAAKNTSPSGPSSQSAKMKLELVDESDHKLTPAPLIDFEKQAPPTPPLGPSKSTDNKLKDALRTHDGFSMQPVRYEDMVLEEEVSLPKGTVVPLEEDDPIKPIESTPVSQFENAFLDEESGEWLSPNQASFRALRATDTPKVLAILHQRLDTHLKQLDHLMPAQQGGLPFSQIAKASGLAAVLPHPLPFTQSPDESPDYHLVGKLRDGSFALIYQDEQKGSFHFTKIPPDGGDLQIALVEGEELLTDQELTKLFQEDAREATPEQAEATAKELQDRLRPKPGESRRPNIPTPPPIAIRSKPVSINEPRGGGQDKAIPVNARTIKRLEFNRNQDMQHLWDENLQPGVAVFRYNIATLFQDNQQVIEGVLLCIVERKQYLVYDRRSKRSVPLDPNGQQKIWLRHDDSLI